MPAAVGDRTVGVAAAAAAWYVPKTQSYTLHSEGRFTAIRNGEKFV